MAIPVIIVTGFLGCGKTSFLRHLLPLCGETNLRPALIINEVGDVDVDGELLADLHSEQVRLVGGCVCCTLQSQLTNTIYDVLERQSCETIIIECSGLSNPIDVVNALSAPALLREIAVSHIVCLLDAHKAEKVLSVADLAKSQVATADIVILNKMDKLDADRRVDLERIVNDLSPDSTIHWASYGDIGLDEMRKILTDPAPTHSDCTCGCCGHDHSHKHEHSHQLPSSFCTVAVTLPENVDRKALDAMIASLPENVIRAR